MAKKPKASKEQEMKPSEKAKAADGKKSNFGLRLLYWIAARTMVFAGIDHSRAMRAQAIIDKNNQIKKIMSRHYEVKSQNSPDTTYDVKRKRPSGHARARINCTTIRCASTSWQ